MQEQIRLHSPLLKACTIKGERELELSCLGTLITFYASAELQMKDNYLIGSMAPNHGVAASRDCVNNGTYSSLKDSLS